MLSRANNVGWMGENRDGENSGVSWNVVNNSGENMEQNGGVGVVENNVVRDDVGSLRNLLEVENDWYNISSNNTPSMQFCNNTPDTTTDNLLLNPTIVDSSSSCSPSPSVFNNPNSLDPSHISYMFPPKDNLFNNDLQQGFDLGNISGGGYFQDTENNHQIADLVGRGGENGGLLGGFSDFSSPHNEMGSPNVGGNPQFLSAHLMQLGGNEGFEGEYSNTRFRGFEEGLMNSSSVFVNRGSKLLKPLDNSAPVGAQPTLFQKRAALRRNFSGGENGENSSGNLLNSGLVPGEGGRGDVKLNSGGDNEKKRKISGLGILDDVSFDGSAFNYDSDDFAENNNFSTLNGGDGSAKFDGTNSNANSTVTGNGDDGGGDFKGKKKGPPAKNLMAERRRRKKLNDRLYMLRSVVPKISKMDRASILGDAIEYLKELLRKINDLHNELESSPTTSSLTQNTNFHPLTPTLPNLPSSIKEELCASSSPSPIGQPARIEVRLREGRAVNIHMFCGRRPGLLLSIMKALDGLGLDIQQAVISCFNGFAMDIFRSEQSKDGEDLHPEQIKAILLDLATFHGSNVVGNCNI